MKHYIDMSEAYPDMWARFGDWLNKPPQNRTAIFDPTLVEPRPEWHGRVCEVLGRGVVRFLSNGKYTYHCVHPDAIKELPDASK